MILAELPLHLLPGEVRRPHQIRQQCRKMANALFTHMVLALLVPIPQVAGQGALHLLLPLPNTLLGPQLLLALLLLLLSLVLPLAGQLAVIAAGALFTFGVFAVLALLLPE